MERKCAEVTKKGTRCKNNATIGDSCMFHVRKSLKELNQDFAEVQARHAKEIRGFWKGAGIVMGTALIVSALCLLAKYYFGIENLPRW